MISIIIRTKNEERWISQCLLRVLNQSIKEIEIILVDNGSTDRTIERAKKIYPDIKLVRVDEYFPGTAINEGVRASRGEYLVCLSAHCLPVKNNWLERLLVNFEDESVAGVYGRQIPMEFSSPADKRDLLVTFGLDKRIQMHDTFFHNANSMIRRNVWQKCPFDEKVTNIEDRVWAKRVIEAGYKLVYEPEAVVYHYHGIHQNNNKERCNNVVSIMQDLEWEEEQEKTNPLDPRNLEIVAIIPVRHHSTEGVDFYEPLILETVRAAQNAEYIDRIVIATDSEDIAKKAKEWGAVDTIVRPIELSLNDVRVDTVLQFTLETLESEDYFPDLIVPLEITYPFRPKGLLDSLVEKLLQEGFDTVIAGFPEYRPCWVKEESEFRRIDDYEKNRSGREPLYIGLPSLGCVTYPEFVRKGSRLGKNIGILKVGEPMSTIEIREPKDLKLLDRVEYFQNEIQATC